MPTIKAQYAKQTATKLEDEPFVQRATAESNHKGPYVHVLVPDVESLDRAYAVVDDYAIWIEIDVAENTEL